MPIYEYECNSCKKVIEITQRISDAPLSECPDCSGSVRKLISVSSFQLKGGGWYADGYNGSSNGNGNGKETSSPAADKGGNGKGTSSPAADKGGNGKDKSCPAADKGTGKDSSPPSPKTDSGASSSKSSGDSCPAPST